MPPARWGSRWRSARRPPPVSSRPGSGRPRTSAAPRLDRRRRRGGLPPRSATTALGERGLPAAVRQRSRRPGPTPAAAVRRGVYDQDRAGGVVLRCLPAPTDAPEPKDVTAQPRRRRKGPGERMTEQPDPDDPVETAPTDGAVVVTRHRDHREVISAVETTGQVGPVAVAGAVQPGPVADQPVAAPGRRRRSSRLSRVRRRGGRPA
jgi:hypothetical protein